MADIVEQLRHYGNQMAPSGLGGSGFALSPNRAPLLKEAAAEIERLRDALKGTTFIVTQAGAEIRMLTAAMRDACDLLAEREHGNPARSPGHNARLRLEAALGHPAEAGNAGERS